MSDISPSQDQVPVTPAPEPESAPESSPSIDVVKAPASKIPDKAALPKLAAEGNKLDPAKVQSLSKPKTNGVTLAIVVTIIVVVVIACLVVFAYTKSK